jgi:rare lipoprotein A
VYVPLPRADGYEEEGIASWYGPGFHGKKTASGEVYDMYANTCAHKLLPLGTTVRVTNLDNQRTVLTRINDRGPFVEGRIIDLSYAVARELGMAERGTCRVRVEAVSGPGGGGPPGKVLEGPFAWQVGAFSVPANAEELARELRRAFPDVTEESFQREGKAVFRVRVGTYRTVAEARNALTALKARGLTPLLVRKD